MSSELIDELLEDAKGRMAKTVDATKTEFGTVRTGRASPALLDRVDVDYYGATTPLRQLANISATEARLLTVTPYDKTSIKAIEKSIMESDLGLTPSNDGAVIRLTAHVRTNVPTRSPDTILPMLDPPAMLNTTIGRLLSMHSANAVESITWSPRVSASLCVISGMNSAFASSAGSAV